MANVYAPFGLRPFGHRDGSAPTMGLERRWMLSSDASVVGTGDVVYNSSTLVGYVTLATSGTVGVGGVFAGCEYYSPTVNRRVWSAYFPGTVSSSSPVTAYLITDPEMTFIAQGSTQSVIGSSAIGLNIGISTNNGNPDTTTGISRCSLLSSFPTGNSSLPFRIVDVYSNFAPPGVNGTDNTVPGAILVVAPHNWDRNTLTGATT